MIEILMEIKINHK